MALMKAVWALALAVVMLVAVAPAQAQVKPRVIVTADPELDDQNSLIRYLLYSSDFDTEGLIYASSQFHWRGDGKGTSFMVPGREYTRLNPNPCPCTSWRWKEGERFIDEAVEHYEQVYDNLKVHDAGYPTPAYLKSRVFEGNVEFDGDMSKDTAGSNRIKEVLLDDEGGPVYLLAWGGQSTIGRALKSIKQTYEGTPEWPAIYAKVSRKAIIQAFGDQDNVNAQYIKPNWPEIEFRQMSTSIWGYGARGAVLPADAHILNTEWMKANVSDVGPFGSFYRVWGDGKQMVPGDVFDYFGIAGKTRAELQAMGYFVWTGPQPQGSWISEGDTSTFMNVVDNGLRAHQDASFGGWGGRNAQDVNPATGTPNSNYASARWFGFAQRDFAARMKWSVTPTFAGANHEPVVSVNGPLNVSAAPGETVRLEGLATDPDGHALTFKWWQYTDADTYPGAVVLSGANSRNVSFEVPANSVVPPNAVPGHTIHMILEVTDDGTPALTRYQRVIVTVSARATQTVTSTVTPTLSLTLGAAPSFGALVPGTARTYTASSTATVTSTAGSATLTAGDVSPVATGRLVNGAHALAAPLQIKAGSGAFQPLGSLSSPITLQTFDGPVTAGQVALAYEQAVGATEALRSGTYSKSVTYTLETTTP